MPTVRSTTASSPLLLNISYQGSCHQKLFMPGTTDPRWRLVISTPSGDELVGVCVASLTVCVPVCSFRFQFVVPKKWRRNRPVCIHLAGTGDHVRMCFSHMTLDRSRNPETGLTEAAPWLCQVQRLGVGSTQDAETCSVFQNQHFLVKVKKTE